MSVSQYIKNDTAGLAPGTYKIIAIGPGGDGLDGNKATGKNNDTSASERNPVNGANGVGGGAGAYVYVQNIELTTMTTVGITITENETSVIMKDFFNPSNVLLDLIIPKAEAGNGKNGGNSLGNDVYSGTSGGGAGGPMGQRGTTALQPVGIGGKGNFYPGANSTQGVANTTAGHTAGNGGIGGNNSASEVTTGGKGGKGASADEWNITDENVSAITVEALAERIGGGNGSNGTAPASRPAQAGIAGSRGSGGGGAWEAGTDGTVGGTVSAGVNGTGGIGGKGGKGCLWIANLAAQKVR